MEEPSDDALVRQLQQGERAAFDALMRRYHLRLHRFLCHYLQDAAAAEDVAQEAFARVYFKAKSFRFESRFSTWLFQIAINLAKDYARKTRRHPLSLDGSPELAATLASLADDPHGQAVAEQMTLKLSAAIDRLPPPLKSALILFALEERSQEECATLLGITPKAVEVRVYRARKQLAKLLAHTR